MHSLNARTFMCAPNSINTLCKPQENGPMPTLRDLTEYHKPTDLDEAVKLLRRRKIRTVPLGGGGDLVSTAPLNIQAVVDLGELGLSYIKPISFPPDDNPADDGLSPAGGGGALEIGATTTLQTLVDDA